MSRHGKLIEISQKIKTTAQRHKEIVINLKTIKIENVNSQVHNLFEMATSTTSTYEKRTQERQNNECVLCWSQPTLRKILRRTHTDAQTDRPTDLDYLCRDVGRQCERERERANETDTARKTKQ